MRALLLRKGKKEVDRREGREEEGICRTNVKVLPAPLLTMNCMNNTNNTTYFICLTLVIITN